MNGLTTQERLNDIKERCGLSEDIIRRVLGAETASALASLKKGERVTLMGRCVMRPTKTAKLGIGGVMIPKIKLSVNPAPSLENSLAEMVEFEESNIDEQIDNGIRLRQIASLA